FLRTKLRDQFLITTKVGRHLARPKDPKTFDRAPWVGGLNFEAVRDYSKRGIMRSYAQALWRLALDTDEPVVIHDLGADDHPAPGVFEARQKDLRDSGIKALEESQEDRRYQGLRHGHQHRRGARRGREPGAARFLSRGDALHAAGPKKPPSRYGGLRETRGLGDHWSTVRLRYSGDLLWSRRPLRF